MGFLDVLNSSRILGEDDLRKRDLGEYDTVTFKTLSATMSGSVAGAFVGALVSMWKYQQPKKNFEAVRLASSALARRYCITYALICGSYAFTDAVVENYRGKRDFVNSIYAGVAAGAVFGVAHGSVSKGVGSAAAFAVSTAVMDAIGHTTKSRRPVDRVLRPFPTHE